MSVERDEGYAALQRGDVTAAIEQLERACGQTPEDYYAHMYLGAAYGQAERHADAVRVLTRSVELDPANAQARYNLGIALERAGWPQEALTAFQQALTLQPDYPKAREAALRLQASQPPQEPPPAPFTVDPMASRTMQMNTESLPSYSQPTMQPGSAPAYAPPTMPMGGTPPYPSVPPSVYSPGTAYAPGAYVPDSFNVGQSFRDWIAVLRAPKEFFRDQAGREGLNAPLSMLITYHLALAAAMGLGLLFTAFSSPAGLPFLLIGFLFALGFMFVFWLIASFFAAGLVHLIGKAFGNSASYAGSFRACTYAQAPFWITACVGMVLATAMTGPTFSQAMREGRAGAQANPYNPGNRGDFNNPGGFNTPPGFPQNPNTVPAPRTYRSAQQELSPAAQALSLLSTVLNWLAFAWALVLLGIGVAHVQRISAGAAVGTVFLAIVVPIGVLIFLLVAFVAALVAGMGMG